MNRTPLLVALVALVALAAAFLPAPRPADAEHPKPVTISVDPAAPTELDVVSVTVAGDMGEQFCGVSSAAFVDLDKTEIGIFVWEASQYCTLLLRPTTFSITEEIGLLPAGEYTVWTSSGKFDAVNDANLVNLEVSGVAGVGGITELPQLERQLLEANSSDVSAGVLAGIVAAAAAGVLALGGAAWYARKRLTS